MTEDFYICEFGWQWVLPYGFERKNTLRLSNMYGVSPSATFCSTRHRQVHLSWSILNGPPVDYVTDARFKSIIADRDPVNTNRLVDVLADIMPLAAALQEARCVRLPDNSDAIEMTMIQHGADLDEPQMLYALIFPVEPAAIERGDDFPYSTLTQFVDPITSQLIVLSPVLLGERLNPETGDVCQVYQVGHDRYQRIIMSAKRSDFEEVISEVRRAARGFHYKTRQRSLRNSWQDAAQLYQDEMTNSFEALANPPTGLTDEDIAASRTREGP